jgi:hypothetical protein
MKSCFDVLNPADPVLVVVIEPWAEEYRLGRLRIGLDE